MLFKTNTFHIKNKSHHKSAAIPTHYQCQSKSEWNSRLADFFLVSSNENKRQFNWADCFGDYVGSIFKFLSNKFIDYGLVYIFER